MSWRHRNTSDTSQLPDRMSPVLNTEFYSSQKWINSVLTCFIHTEVDIGYPLMNKQIGGLAENAIIRKEYW